MTSPSPEVLQNAVVLSNNNWSAAARLLSEQGFTIGRDTVRRRYEKMIPTEEGSHTEADFEFAEKQLSGEVDVDTILARRKVDFDKKLKAFEQHRHVRIKVKMDGPIGLGWFGDPHIDDDGTDVNLLFEHAKLFDGRNPGLYGNCVGDFRNLWIGAKLMKKHAHQSTTAAQAAALLTELMNMIQWLIVVKGNHDCWAGDDDLLDWLSEKTTKVMRATRVMVDLVFPNGKEVELYVAHTFKGSSMWSSAYGPARKAQTHRGCRMYICGHLHEGAYTHGFHPDGRMWHAMRLGSYKYIDDYVEVLDIEPVQTYVCPVSIINPYASSENSLITWDLDPYEGAERLAWMRKRWEMGKSTDT